MLKEVKCLSCQAVLYRIGPLDENGKFWGLYEEDKEGYLSLSKASVFTSRQECPPVYMYNGAIYIINTRSLYKSPLYAFKKIKKYEMNELTSIDIDTELDWKWAEFLLSNDLIKNKK